MTNALQIIVPFIVTGYIAQVFFRRYERLFFDANETTFR